VDLDIGRRYRVATADVDFINEQGDKVQYTGAIINEIADNFRVDIFSRTTQRTDIQITLPLALVPFDQARRAGVIFQNSLVRVRWGVAGRDHEVGQAIPILSGYISSPKIDTREGTVSFTVKSFESITGAPFPPAVAVDDYIADIDPEAVGKTYPIIIGNVKKCPAFAIDAGVNEKFLVAADPFYEHTSNPTAGYDGDDTLPTAGGSNSQTVDGGGNAYFWYQFPGGSGADSKDVTFDVAGSSESSLDKVIQYLIRGFGRWDYGSDNRRNLSPSDIVDMESLVSLGSVGSIAFAMIINQRSSGGVIKFIRDRILPQVPVVMFQDGGKIKFKSLWWDRKPVKRLSYSKNILRRVAPIAETDIDNIYNSFTFNYAVNGYRGDYEGCLVRDWNNDGRCAESRRRYGIRAMDTVDFGDLANSSAAVSANWFVDTFSKMRVFTSYECNLDVVNVHMLDTVELEDEHEGWGHAPLFRVHGIRRTTGPSILLDLVSVDDYVDVYRTNYRAAAIVGPEWPTPLRGWGDGVPDFNHDENNDGWGDGGPDFG
jgi:hypothetical protein